MNETRQYLYRVQPARPEMLVQGPTDDEARAIDEHFGYLDGLARAGTVLLAGRTLNQDSSAFGIVIFSAASDEAALLLMGADPAVQTGVMRADLFPFRVALVGAR